MHVVCGSPARAHLAYGCRHVSTSRTRKPDVTTRRERHRAGVELVVVVVVVGGGGGGSGGALSAPDYSPLVEVGAWLSGVLKLAHPPPCRLANLQKLNCPLVLFLGTISTRLHNLHNYIPHEKEKKRKRKQKQNQNQNQN